MACRTLLKKLAEEGLIELPKMIKLSRIKSVGYTVQPVFHDRSVIEKEIGEISPVSVRLIDGGYELKLFKYLISAYHYLGWSGTVGENLKYLITDKDERPLGCVLFGAAAWKIRPRDEYIGWEAAIREQNLRYIANNNRYLILPWVKVPHLASHVLGKISRRLSVDFERKYNHAVYLLETFVDKERFKGTCYRAANWIDVGETQGRGKMDRKNEYAVPVKDIYIYPLIRDFRKRLQIKT
jgi:hypothetical protein